MPELPIIEFYCHQLNDKATHQRIKAVHLEKPKVVKHMDANHLVEQLTGKSFTACTRYGKLIILHTDDQHDFVVHLGLRGSLAYTLKASRKKTFALQIDFESGAQLTYQTLFGMITLVPDIKAFLAEEKMGPDALTISKIDFSNALKHSRGDIKSVLMDQHAMAGLGNIYTDEILFQSHLDPRWPCKDLSDKQVTTLYQTTHKVLDTAIKTQGQWKRLPSSFLTVQRKTDLKCPIDGGELETAKVAGRTSYFCPRCQVKAG